jgi:hypothetical protein
MIQLLRKNRGGVVGKVLIAVTCVCSQLAGQTNPAPQSLPYAQDFGTAAFAVLPAGFGAWNGMSGAAILSQAAAEASVPTSNAPLSSATGVKNTGGIYGYASSDGAMIYLQGSNNQTNGVNQAMLSISTKGASSIKMNYSITMLFPSSRSASLVLQWRGGSVGPWKTVENSAYEGNSTTRTVGEKTLFTDLIIPSAAENRDTVQLRWAFWHGIESGNVSGIGIDDISIYSGAGTSAPASPTLVSLADNAVNQPLSLQVAWNASSRATSYRLQVAANAAFDPVLLDSANIAGLSMTLTNLTSNSVYYWRVSATNALGSSEFSPARTFSTLWTIPPGMPFLLSPVNGGTGYAANVLLTWTGVVGAMTYRCQVASDSLFYAITLDDSTITAPQVQVKGLAGNSTYWWRVLSKNTAGVSSYSSAWKFTTARVYQIPQQILFSGSTGQTLADSITSSYTAAKVLTYSGAREKIYGEIDKVGDTLKCVYTGYACYMPLGLSALTAALDGNMNAEHTFPQSVGADTGNANSDMHHIFAAKGNVNSARGNLPYAELSDANVLTWYHLSESRSTKPAGDITEYSKLGTFSFEPRDAHKGHVARAIFYFYTIYKAQSSASFFEGMKATLLKWHSQFPVDSSEYARTNKIAVYQSGKANPFILDTTLVRRVYAPSVTSVAASGAAMPAAYVLEQNYPNPFNPSTAIRFSVPEAAMVTLAVYDVLGRTVSTLIHEMKSPGQYTVHWNAAAMTSGMYFYRLEAGSYSSTRRLVVQK